MLDREPDLLVVAHVGSIAEVRELLRTSSDPIDIALIDLTFPDGAGIDLINPLHKHYPACQILALTANGDKRDHARAIAAGLAGTMHKSLSLEAIIETIRRVSRGESAHPPEELVALLRLASRMRGERQTVLAGLERLTPRERQILEALSEGMTDKEIALSLRISTNTVAAHIVHILSKLDVHSRLQAVLLAIRYGAVELR